MFCDIESDTLNIDAKQLEPLITKRTKRLRDEVPKWKDQGRLEFWKNGSTRERKPLTTAVGGQASRLMIDEWRSRQ